MNLDAEILTIGDEILIGQTVDTNSAWIGEKMSMLGLPVRRIVSVSDIPEEIETALAEALTRVDVVIITGGLGPTRDDRTKDTLCRLFGGELVFDPQVWEDIQALFRHRDVPLNDLNRRQAMVPSVCVPLRNFQGTAPGMWFTRGKQLVISLPGVPYEMKDMMERTVLPRLAETFSLPVILHRNIMTTGIPESKLAQILEPWELDLPPQVSLAYLPSPGMIRLRLSGKSDNREALKAQLDQLAAGAVKLIPKAVYGYEGVTLDAALGELMKRGRLTIAAAESCTGGYLSHLLTRNPGSSNFFNGSLVAYSNDIKHRFLGVSEELLLQYGAVSEQVVRQMAVYVREVFGTDYSLAISGIAGPDGGTPDKPVGTVWIAVSGASGTEARHYNLGEHRERHIIRSSMAALNMLRLRILEDFPELGSLLNTLRS